MSKHFARIVYAIAVAIALLAAYERGKQAGIDAAVAVYVKYGYPGYDQ